MREKRKRKEGKRERGRVSIFKIKYNIKRSTTWFHNHKGRFLIDLKRLNKRLTHLRRKA